MVGQPYAPSRRTSLIIEMTAEPHFPHGFLKDATQSKRCKKSLDSLTHAILR